MRRVGMWSRVSALSLDWAMSMAVAWALLPKSGGFRQFGPLLVFFLEVWVLVALQGASAGQRVLGIRVQRFTDRGAPTAYQALVRTFLLCLVVTAITFDEDGRAPHERLSGTVLAYKGN